MTRVAATMRRCNLGHTENTCANVGVVISTKHTCRVRRRSKDTKSSIMHTLWAQWWQVLVPNFVIMSVSLISEAADGGW